MRGGGASEMSGHPAPQMTTWIPRLAALETYSWVIAGVRWADMIRHSKSTSNRPSMSAQACMVDLSEADPMMIATRGWLMTLPGAWFSTSDRAP